MSENGTKSITQAVGDAMSVDDKEARVLTAIEQRKLLRIFSENVSSKVANSFDWTTALKQAGVSWMEFSLTKERDPQFKAMCELAEKQLVDLVKGVGLDLAITTRDKGMVRLFGGPPSVPVPPVVIHNSQQQLQATQNPNGPAQIDSTTRAAFGEPEEAQLAMQRQERKGQRRNAGLLGNIDDDEAAQFLEMPNAPARIIDASKPE